jgi:hypothetical protein
MFFLKTDCLRPPASQGTANKRLSFAAKHFNERRGNNSGGGRRHVAQFVEQALPVYCAELIESDLSALSLKAYRHPCRVWPQYRSHGSNDCGAKMLVHFIW